MVIEWRRLPIGSWHGFKAGKAGVLVSVNWYGIAHWRRDPDGLTRLDHQTRYWVAWINGPDRVCLGLDHRSWTTPEQAMAAAEAHLGASRSG